MYTKKADSEDGKIVGGTSCICPIQETFEHSHCFHINSYPVQPAITAANNGYSLFNIGCPSHQFSTMLYHLNKGLGFGLMIVCPQQFFHPQNQLSSYTICATFNLYARKNTSKVRHLAHGNYIWKFKQTKSAHGDYKYPLWEFSKDPNATQDTLYLNLRIKQLEFDVICSNFDFNFENSTDLADDKVTIVCGPDMKKAVPVMKISRYFLYNSSGYFRTLFHSKVGNPNENQLLMTEPFAVVKIVVNHMCDPKVPLSTKVDDLLDEVYNAADKYHIPSLEHAVLVRYVQANPVPISMLIRLMKLAIHSPNQVFWNSILKFDALEQMSELTKDGEFRELISSEYANGILDLLNAHST